MQTKVLYVEDETFLAKIVKESLESRGFDVRWLADGNTLTREFEEFQPDVCVLDIMLPGKDGLQLAQDIKQMTDHVPIIFLTAKSQTQDVIDGFSSGGNDYLKKPFSMEELIVRINNLLSMTRSRANNVGGSYQLGAIVFDPLRMTLTNGDIQKKLSHREVELLKLFAENQNLPVDRKKILLQVWGDDNIFNSRNLDVYITRLRKYIKSDPNLQLITLKGVGYQFITQSP